MQNARLVLKAIGHEVRSEKNAKAPGCQKAKQEEKRDIEHGGGGNCEHGTSVSPFVELLDISFPSINTRKLYVK